MQIPVQKDQIAIVVVGYNRLDSTKRLYRSIVEATYTSRNVPLIFSIDASGNQELYDWVKNVEWPFGPKYVRIQEERQGLRKHIYLCGDLTDYFKGVIILEDDILVAPDFYKYTKKVVDFYYDDDRIAGIALFADQSNGYAQGLPNFRYNDGSDAYLLQEVCTSGECFTDKMWDGFRSWMKNNPNPDPQDYYMPDSIKNWKQAWSKFYNMYLLDKDYYFLTPYLSRTTNCGDAGVHSTIDLNFLHSQMLWGVKDHYEFKRFHDAVKYDIFGNYIGLGKYLAVDEDKLCLDLYGNKPLKPTQRYLCSLYRLPYKLIQTYGLVLEPIEMNIIKNICGEDIYVYDTHYVTKGKFNFSYTLRQLSYFMRGISFKLQLRFSILTIKSLIRSKFKRLLRYR